MATAAAALTEQQCHVRIELLAPVVLAAMLSCVSLGFVAALASSYLSKFARRDRIAFCALVVFLFVAAIVDTAFQVRLAFDWSVLGFGDYAQFKKSPWQLPLYCFTSGIPVCVVQLAYAHRVWIMSGRSKHGIALVACIVAGALAALGCIVRCSAFFFQHHNLFDFDQIRPMLIAWLFLLVVVDVLITLGVFFFLVHKPKKTSGGLLKTDSRVLSLASIAVKTNLISLLCQVSILALVFAFPKAFHFVTTSFIISKIYTGSLIAMLNIRDPATLLSSSSIPKTPHGDLHAAEWSTRVNSVVEGQDDQEAGRRSTLSLGLGLQQNPSSGSMKMTQRAFETKLSLGRSDRRNVSFFVNDAGSRGGCATPTESTVQGEEEGQDEVAEELKAQGQEAHSYP